MDQRKVGTGGTALITGAKGFIGRRLLRPGERALVRRPAGLENEVGGGLEHAGRCLACSGAAERPADLSITGIKQTGNMREFAQ